MIYKFMYNYFDNGNVEFGRFFIKLGKKIEEYDRKEAVKIIVETVKVVAKEISEEKELKLKYTDIFVYLMIEVDPEYVKEIEEQIKINQYL